MIGVEEQRSEDLGLAHALLDDGGRTSADGFPLALDGLTPLLSLGLGGIVGLHASQEGLVTPGPADVLRAHVDPLPHLPVADDLKI